jgi:hypothetical protein
MSVDFKLDRTKFEAMSFEAADAAMNDFKSFSPIERLEIANKLIAIAYNFPVGCPPPMDKTVFEVRSMKNDL